MSPEELREYVHKLEVETDNMESYVFDLALYSDGAISVAELLSMPMPNIKKFEDRLQDKLRKANNTSGTEYL